MPDVILLCTKRARRNDIVAISQRFASSPEDEGDVCARNGIARMETPRERADFRINILFGNLAF